MLEQIVFPLVGSLAAGILIGFEREYKSRPAGLRTHTLVSLASTLLMLAAARQGDWEVLFIDDGSIVTDPTRMAHGILTGLGFLCAGVIVRHGFSIQGLTTATSLWMTSALGILFGVGLYDLAIAGTVVTLVVLLLFRLLYRYLPRRGNLDIVVRVETGAGMDGTELERLLARHGLRGEVLRHRLLEGGAVLELSAKAVSPQLVRLEPLSRALRGIDGMRGFEIAPRED